MKKDWYLYILHCYDGSLYTGITTNVDSRLKIHQRGKGAKYTAGRRPLTLVYQEKFPDATSARKTEASIKRWSKKRKEQLIISNNG